MESNEEKLREEIEAVLDYLNSTKGGPMHEYYMRHIEAQERDMRPSEAHEEAVWSIIGPLYCDYKPGFREELEKYIRQAIEEACACNGDYLYSYTI